MIRQPLEDACVAFTCELHHASKEELSAFIDWVNAAQDQLDDNGPTDADHIPMLALAEKLKQMAVKRFKYFKS